MSGESTKVAKIGTFNLEFGRKVSTAVSEAIALMERHQLTALCLQESSDYAQHLRTLPFGYKFFGRESGVLVAPGHEVADDASDYYGDGWKTVTGLSHRPVEFTRVTIDGWLRLASTHWPTPTIWKGDVITGPSERIDDTVAIAERCQKFLSFKDKKVRVIGADFNEGPQTNGRLSPSWIAHQVGTTYQTAPQTEGHGKIDGFIVVRGELTNVRKDLTLKEGSDHEPVIGRVTAK